MDSKRWFELQQAYRVLPENELIEMAMVDEKEYEEGVYELIINAIKERKLEKKLDEVKRIEQERQEKSQWVELYRFYEDIEGECLMILLKEKHIETDLISRHCSAYDGLWKASAGAGIIRVRKENFEKSQEVLSDFEKMKQLDIKSASNEIIKNAVIEVFARHDIDNKEKLADEIVKEINKIER